jgi:hypothetical protein
MIYFFLPFTFSFFFSHPLVPRDPVFEVLDDERRENKRGWIRKKRRLGWLLVSVVGCWFLWLVVGFCGWLLVSVVGFWDGR